MGTVINYRRWVSEVVYQPIVDRLNSVVGFECLARVDGVQSIEQFASMAEPWKLDALMDEVINQIKQQLSFAFLAESLVGKKLFINADKCNLANPLVVDSILYFADYLSRRDVVLVIEVAERELHACCSFRSYIEGVRRLALGGVSIALDDFLLDEHARTELELGLCQIVKIEVDALPLRYDVLCGAAESDALIVVRNSLEDFAALYKVELLLERVEQDYCLDILASLPFDYFQGYRFGVPGLLCPSVPSV